MTTTATTYDTTALERDVATYLDLDERIKDLQAQQGDIRARLRKNLPVGKHATGLGVVVTVSPPSRRFNLVKAVELLPEELREECRADGYEAGKVKRFLSPALLDIAMEPGAGEAQVRIA